MKGLREKFQSKKGFTLIEMLIVVAIIAILIAVSIPLVNSALERSREATDAANERSFKAALLISYLSGEVEGTPADKFATKTLYYYDADEGTINSSLASGASLPKYGKSTTVKGVDNLKRDGLCLVGFIDASGQVQMIWTDSFTASTDASLPAGGIALIGPKMVAGTTDTTP